MNPLGVTFEVRGAVMGLDDQGKFRKCNNLVLEALIHLLGEMLLHEGLVLAGPSGKASSKGLLAGRANAKIALR